MVSENHDYREGVVSAGEESRSLTEMLRGSGVTWPTSRSACFTWCFGQTALGLILALVFGVIVYFVAEKLVGKGA